MARERTPTRLESADHDSRGTPPALAAIPSIRPNPQLGSAQNELQGQATAPGLPRPIRYHPVSRPPMALLVVADDGSSTGATIRLLKDETVIGREGADVNIGHDTQISRKHAAIVRSPFKGSHRWFLEDGNSSNGTFVRLAKAKLKAENEFLIGSKRFRFFEAAKQVATDLDETENIHAATTMWQAVSKDDLESAVPRLVLNQANA